ncbi:MAG: CoA pyrophosphatase [Pseudomonadota bacterium]
MSEKFTQEKICSKYHQLEKPSIPKIETIAKPSAVTIVLRYDEHQMQMLFTKRQPYLKNHGGQISFPGGRYEEKDGCLEQTAVRETYEEIGLDPQYLKILGPLVPSSTITGFTIVPYIGFAPKKITLSPETSEVATIFEVPLDYLANPSNQLEHKVEHQGKTYLLPAYRYHEFFIWGATARIVSQFTHKLLT